VVPVSVLSSSIQFTAEVNPDDPSHARVHGIESGQTAQEWGFRLTSDQSYAHTPVKCLPEAMMNRLRAR
jgi:hypothetical protein